MTDQIYMQFSATEQTGQAFIQDGEALFAVVQRLQNAMNNLYASGLQGAFLDELQAHSEQLLGTLRYFCDESDEAGQELLMAARLLREVDTACAARFAERGNAGTDLYGNAVDPQTGKTLERIYDGAVPAYRLNLNDPSVSTERLLAQIPNSQGRPIMFVIHGWHTSDAYAKAGFEETAKWYSERYSNLPESERPIIVGVDWDSDVLEEHINVLGEVRDGVSYIPIQMRAEKTGNVLADVIKDYRAQAGNENAEILITAHSMGNVVAVNAIQNAQGVQFNGYLAIESVVEASDLSVVGKYRDVINSERVGAIYNTRSLTDLPLLLNPYDTADSVIVDNPIVSIMPLGARIIGDRAVGTIGIQGGGEHIHNVNLDDLNDIQGTKTWGHYSFAPSDELPEIEKATSDFLNDVLPKWTIVDPPSQDPTTIA